MKKIKLKILFIGIAIILIAIPLFTLEDEFEEFSNEDIIKIENLNNEEEIKQENKFLKIVFDNNIIFITITIILGFISFYYKRLRFRYIILLSSLVFLGFYIGGCNCSVGAFIKFFYNIFYDKKNIIALALLIAVPLISTIFFGRIFCGYVCPLGALQEFVAIRDKLIKIDYKLEKKLRYIRLVLFIILITVTFISSEFVYTKIAPFKAIFNIKGGILQIIFAGLILLLSLFIYRPFCRYACPFSLVLELAGKFSFYKLKKNISFCQSCKACQKKCPISVIDENNNIDNGACIRCGECLDCYKGTSKNSFSSS